MCDFFSLVLALLLGALVVFFGAVGLWLLLRPQAYLRFFAHARMEVYHARGWSEAEIDSLTRGSLFRRWFGMPYSQWLQEVSIHPERHKKALLVARIGGGVLLAAAIGLGLAWLGSVLFIAAGCL